MLVRECAMDDFEGVFALLEQLWPERELDRDTMLGTFRECLESDSIYFACAFENGEPFAFVSIAYMLSLWSQGTVAYIGELVVDERRRSKGIGALMLEHACKEARARGCNQLVLDSAFHRKGAHRFYANRGFEERGVIFGKGI